MTFSDGKLAQVLVDYGLGVWFKKLVLKTVLQLLGHGRLGRLLPCYLWHLCRSPVAAVIMLL